jgi:ribosomal protein L20
MDRKVLADLAVTEPYSFKAVVDIVKSVGQRAA